LLLKQNLNFKSFLLLKQNDVQFLSMKHGNYLQGETKSFSKKGFKIPGYFLSVLPGGNGTEYGFGPTGMLKL
jgi:hypothetical protein